MRICVIHANNPAPGQENNYYFISITVASRSFNQAWKPTVLGTLQAARKTHKMLNNLYIDVHSVYRWTAERKQMTPFVAIHLVSQGPYPILTEVNGKTN